MLKSDDKGRGEHDSPRPFALNRGPSLRERIGRESPVEKFGQQSAELVARAERFVGGGSLEKLCVAEAVPDGGAQRVHLPVGVRSYQQLSLRCRNGVIVGVKGRASCFPGSGPSTASPTAIGALMARSAKYRAISTSGDRGRTIVSRVLMDLLDADRNQTGFPVSDSSGFGTSVSTLPCPEERVTGEIDLPLTCHLRNFFSTPWPLGAVALAWLGGEGRNQQPAPVS